MKIVQIEYRRLRTFGSYQNETVGAVAEIELGGDADSALADLRAWVDAQLGDEEERGILNEAVNELRWRKDQMERDIARVEDRWKAITAFLEKLGIERPAEIPDDLSTLPF